MADQSDAELALKSENYGGPCCSQFSRLRASLLEKYVKYSCYVFHVFLQHVTLLHTSDMCNDVRRRRGSLKARIPIIPSSLSMTRQRTMAQTHGVDKQKGGLTKHSPHIYGPVYRAMGNLDQLTRFFKKDLVAERDKINDLVTLLNLEPLKRDLNYHADHVKDKSLVAAVGAAIGEVIQSSGPKTKHARETLQAVITEYEKRIKRVDAVVKYYRSEVHKAENELNVTRLEELGRKAEKAYNKRMEFVEHEDPIRWLEGSSG